MEKASSKYYSLGYQSFRFIYDLYTFKAWSRKKRIYRFFNARLPRKCSWGDRCKYFFKNNDNELHTPIPDSFLDGITRRCVIQIAKSKNIKIIERKIKPKELSKFTGCFLTGTAAEITPVSQIDNYKFTVCDLIKNLSESYINLVRKKVAA